MSLLRTYLLPFFLLLLLGCEEFYQPDIEDKSGNLVVEAMLSNQNTTMIVKLSRTIFFNKTNYFEGEKNAQVFLHSLNGQTYTFHRFQIGYYESDSIIKTQTGENYYLQIITENGEEYHSEIEEMMPSTGINDIQLFDSTQLTINYNSYGEPFTSETPGIYVSVLPEIPSRPDVGFLYQWNFLINYLVISDRGMETYNYYCWLKRNSSTLYVYDYNDEDTGYSLLMDKIYFLTYKNLSPFPVDSTRFKGLVNYIGTTGFYYKLKQYTISNAGAEFWKSVKTQSESDGKLFDPVEENIGTNIYCVSDTSKEAFGFFNTAAYSEKIIRVRIGSEIIYTLEVIDDFPAPREQEECLRDERTTFWF